MFLHLASTVEYVKIEGGNMYASAWLVIRENSARTKGNLKMFFNVYNGRKHMCCCTLLVSFVTGINILSLSDTFGHNFCRNLSIYTKGFDHCRYNLSLPLPQPSILYKFFFVNINHHPLFIIQLS